MNKAIFPKTSKVFCAFFFVAAVIALSFCLIALINIVRFVSKKVVSELRIELSLSAFAILSINRVNSSSSSALSSARASRCSINSMLSG